jgi:hypothetical protein
MESVSAEPSREQSTATWCDFGQKEAVRDAAPFELFSRAARSSQVLLMERELSMLEMRWLPKTRNV